MSGIVWLCEGCHAARGTNLVKVGEQEHYVCPRCDPSASPNNESSVADFPLATVLDMNPRLRARTRRFHNEAG